MRGAAFLVVTLALSNVGFCKKKPRDKGMDISQLDLNMTDPSVLASKNVDTLACRQKFDFSSGSSVAIESPNYPDNYPDGRAGRCNWKLSVPALAELSMFCESFDVKRGDKLCITDINNYDRACYYGYSGEPFEFPLNVSPSEWENYVYMQFRTNRRRNGKGFRFEISILSRLGHGIYVFI